MLLEPYQTLLQVCWEPEGDRERQWEWWRWRWLRDRRRYRTLPLHHFNRPCRYLFDLRPNCAHASNTLRYALLSCMSCKSCHDQAAPVTSVGLMITRKEHCRRCTSWTGYWQLLDAFFVDGRRCYLCLGRCMPPCSKICCLSDDFRWMCRLCGFAGLAGVRSCQTLGNVS